MVFRKVVRLILCQKTEKPLTCDLASEKNSEREKTFDYFFTKDNDCFMDRA